MKSLSGILTFLVIIAITLVGGCGKAQRSAKPSADGGVPKASVAADPSTDKADVPSKPGEAPASAPVPRYEPPAASERDKLSEGGIDPREKAEVTESALEFAQKNIPGVKHIKVCFSKLYGGWYMLVFTEKGKKASMEHWSWISKTKEWEVITKKKQLTPKEMEFELKGEVAGEKCFFLK
jgi:hypothetical protein